ncbi:hypothetical protein BDV93DRAFT_228673 [Ceratobasidium sp. AG-I]|nr:hypothetical protein BDV93DRAFT_228673 [Ceratobasidium sp. AG-I]
MLIRRLLLVAFTIIGVEAGNTTCKSNSLDWFTESVGETPCRVYERLRQTCSPSFQVGNMKAVPCRNNTFRIYQISQIVY